MRFLLVLLLALQGCSIRHVSFGEGPAVFILSTVETIEDPSMTPLRDMLVEAGYKVIALDFPCHGKETGGLECWRSRIEKGETFDAYVSDVLKMLDEENAVAVIGVSRAGYLTLRIAERDTGKRVYGLISPVVDLLDLAEFKGVKSAPGINPKYLTGKRIFLAIGKSDDRVNTDRSVWLAKEVQSVKLLLTDTEGHGHPPIDQELVQWIRTF